MKLSNSFFLAAAVTTGAAGVGVSGCSKPATDTTILATQQKIEATLNARLEQAGVDVSKVMVDAGNIKPGTPPYYQLKAVMALHAVADHMRKLPPGFSQQELNCLTASQRVVNNARILLATTGCDVSVADPALAELAAAVDAANSDNTNEAVDAMAPGAQNPEVVRDWATELATAYRARIKTDSSKEDKD